MDRATSAVLARLRRGPASTVELQAELYATHVAKQIFDLRDEYECVITTKRLPNGVALYTLISEPDVPVGAGQHGVVNHVECFGSRPGSNPAPSRAPVPQFGDVALLREMRRKS